MNDTTQNRKPADSALTETKKAAEKPSLADAVRDVFDVNTQQAYAPKLAAFARAVTNAAWCCVVVIDDDDTINVIAGTHPDRFADELSANARPLLSGDVARQGQTIVRGSAVYARIARPNGTMAVLTVGLAQTAGVQNALAFERVVFLSELSFSTFVSKRQITLDTLIAQTRSIAQGNQDDLSELADLLALHTGAQYCAVCVTRNGDLRDIKVSGQNAMTKRASLGVLLRKEMKSTADLRLITQERAFAAAPDQSDGLVLHLERPTRNPATLQLIAAVYSLNQKAKPRPFLTATRLVKMGAFALVLVGVALVPLPDGVDLPATVQAQNQRVVTAPVTATLAFADIVDGARVVAGQTVLVRMDASETELELLNVRAEQAKAMLDREAARAQRNAAALRNAELEVERLNSRITLLEARKNDAVILAPISGVVVAPNLAERQGTTIRQGEDLLVISATGALRLQVTIPESQIGRLADDAVGLFRPDFDPTLRIDSQMSLISPAGLGEATEKMFPGRAEFTSTTEGLRAGMTGVLSVQRDLRPLGAIVYRAVRDFVLLRIWL